MSNQSCFKMARRSGTLDAWRYDGGSDIPDEVVARLARSSWFCKVIDTDDGNQIHLQYVSGKMWSHSSEVVDAGQWLCFYSVDSEELELLAILDESEIEVVEPIKVDGGPQSFPKSEPDWSGGGYALPANPGPVMSKIIEAEKRDNDPVRFNRVSRADVLNMERHQNIPSLVVTDHGVRLGEDQKWLDIHTDGEIILVPSQSHYGFSLYRLIETPWGRGIGYGAVLERPEMGRENLFPKSALTVWMAKEDIPGGDQEE